MEVEDQFQVLKVPYLGKLSIVFAKRLKNLLSTGDQRIRTIYQTTKVQNSFVLKDSIPKEISSKVVYKFTCRGDPGTNYIGFTNRTLRERVREHVASGTTAISDHISVCKKCYTEGVTMVNFKIIKKC